jgi:uncharacterized protein (TIGR00255 family)
MIKSMTGFGRGRYEGNTFACSVEIKAVNHRFLDLHAKLPSELGELELLIKRWVQSRVKRGRIDLLVTIDRNETVSFSLNSSLLRAYLLAFAQLRSDFGLGGEMDPVQLLRTPGILNFESPSLSGESLAMVREGLDQAVQSALQDLDHMRIEEGEALYSDILGRLETIQQEATAIRTSTAGALGACQERLQTRLNELLKGVPVDPARVVQEAAFYVERSDIAEELTRLESHVEQSKGLLSNDQDVGKTMDFLLQEMNREANTILSKTTGVVGCGLEISNRAILIKSEIEKIREQIQNVE